MAVAGDDDDDGFEDPALGCRHLHQRRAGTVTVLVVDDLRQFVFPARYARDADTAITMLELAQERGECFEALWLDHDLGLSGTVRPVLAWLEQAHHDGTLPVIGEIVICTASPVGRDLITIVAQRLGIPGRIVDATDYLRYDAS